MFILKTLVVNSLIFCLLRTSLQYHLMPTLFPVHVKAFESTWKSGPTIKVVEGEQMSLGC